MSLAMKARQKVKKKTVKDKIFGCNLMEHLQLSGQEVPQVLKSCTEFVEEHGIVDGIYRLCGIASNVQKLRQEFDMERPPDLNKSTYLQDVHCVSSLCKAYFRELPNPLLTYQLYDKFADAVAIQLEEQRLIKIREVLKELPLPHYRTLEYLMKHLVFMASFSSQTNMHARNLAIVWAPNLLRSKDIESSGFNGTAAFMEVRVQSIVVEFILTHVEQLFGVGTIPGKENDSGPSATMNWPSCVPEEYYRSLSYNLPNILNHGDGPPQIRPYHTIIEFSDNKRKGSIKAKKWKSIFNLGRSSHDSKRKSHKQDDKDGKSDNMNLRPAKSMDSLSSVPYTPDETSITEDSDPKVENNQILFDVQDSFSFLDNQDPSPENNDICQSEETSHKIADYSVDSEILEYELQTAIQMEEFSVEPPPDDLCTEDESEQMYFMPTGCLDAKHQWRESHDSLEDVYLSAYDDLSPLPLESVEMKLDEVTKVHRESEDISMNTENQGTEKYCILNESLPTNTESHDNELQLCGHQLDIDTMETTMDGSHNIMPEAEVHYSQHCNLEDKAAIENVAYIEESECCMVKDQKVHDNNPDNKAYAANPGSIQLQNTGDLSSNDDKLEDQTTMESPGPIELQKGKSYSKDEKPEDEAIKECPGPIELQDGGTYSKDQDPEDGVIMESPGPIELQIGGSYSKDEKPEDEAIQECPGPIELQDGGTYSKDQDPEDGVIMESPGPIELQIGGSYSKDEKPEDEAIKECRGPIELQDGGTYIKHNNLEDKANVEIADPIEVDDGRIYSKDETPEDGTIMESPGPIEIPDGGSYNQHLEDEATVDGPSPEELQDSGLGSKCKSLGHQVAIKNLGSVEFQDHEHYNLVDAGKEIDCRTSQDGGAHAQNLNILADKTTLDSADYKDNSLTNIHIYHCDDHDLQQTVDNIINMSVNSLSGVDDAARIFSSPSQVETAEEHHWANEEHWEELKSISGNQLCFKEDSQTSDPCSSAEGYGLSERINLIPLSKDHFIQQDGSTESKPQEFNQTCSPEELRLSNVTKSSELDDTEISGTYYDGSVTMKLTSTTSKIQQTKSVPVVPPKPQFAKLPPALKSKVHVSSLSTKPQKSGMSSRVEPAESGNDSIPKRRTSWRNATSVSFDTAMALAKERQQSQNPVRRMQTYCIGDSYDVLDSSKIDHTPHVQKFTIKSANNRTNRPYSCLSITSSEAELRGKNLVRDEPNALTIHGSQPILSRGPDVYTQELPHRNRLSMPRLGRQSSGDDLTDLCLQQRRSLL
ncbi:rho GTPase-activating protein 30 isoform X2 [Mixophyes fleayi]|uniref:rho GTPase-activating protein 30 isoform X2 n=1 Tax=Mixophyes fleayi TaxID=3061075 RepID=UPI003F4E2F17